MTCFSESALLFAPGFAIKGVYLPPIKYGVDIEIMALPQPAVILGQPLAMPEMICHKQQLVVQIPFLIALQDCKGRISIAFVGKLQNFVFSVAASQADFHAIVLHAKIIAAPVQKRQKEQ